MARKQAANTIRRTDKATQAVAAILQEFGRYGFDISQRSQIVLQEMCARWIAHLLHGAGSPARQDLDESWLDWPGVRDFVARERGREQSYVLENIDEYQDLALSLLHEFSDSLHSEQDSDTELRDRLATLRTNATEKSGDELKEEVFSAVRQLNEVLEAKRERQDGQLRTLARQVETLQFELVEAKDSAERDALTGLFNRGSFDKFIAQTVSRRPAAGGANTLIVADIDHFKLLNDTYGHPFGDEVLREVSATIARVLSGEGSFVARYGGEEFVAVTPTSIEPTRIVADRVLSEVRSLKFEKDDSVVSVTISLGLAELSEGMTPESWIELGDRALYASKESGRNRLTIAGG